MLVEIADRAYLTGMKNNKEKPITIKDLYPNLSEEELVQAEQNLKRYVEIVSRIYSRLKAEGKKWPDPEDHTLE